MTRKSTLSFTKRHREFLSQKVAEGVFASRSAAVAAAVEQMIADEAEREKALGASPEEIRARLLTSRSEFVEKDRAFAAARARTGERSRQ